MGYDNGYYHVRKPRTYKKKRNNRYNRRRGTGGLEIAKQALSIATYVKSLINVERKYSDFAVSVPIPDTGLIYLLTGIAQGTTATTRDGISIKATSNSMKYDLLLQNVDSIVRCVIFIDDTSNGVLPTVAELLDPFAPGTGTIAHYNKTNAGGRFKILTDKVVTLNTQNFSNRHETIYDKLSHHVKYLDNPSGIQTNCMNGHVYALFISDTVTPANQPLVNVSNRFSFVDN